MREIIPEEVTRLIIMLEEGKVGEFLDTIDNTHASAVYLFIKNKLTQKHIRIIKEASTETNPYYQLFQDIKLKAKKSWEHDHKTATMEDVDKACTNLYTLILRIWRAYNDGVSEELIKIHDAINKIEEKLGIDATDWNQQDTIEGEPEPPADTNVDGGTDDVNNEQGVKEDI